MPSSSRTRCCGEEKLPVLTRACGDSSALQASWLDSAALPAFDVPLSAVSIVGTTPTA